MGKSCKHTHSHRAYFTKYILNIKELAEPFCIIWATVQHYWSKLHTAFTLHQISTVFQLNQSIVCFRNGAPPLHVAVQEALYHITALPVGTHRALLEMPYFSLNNQLSINSIKTKKMKENILYEPPKVEVIEVEVEGGFAVTSRADDTNEEYEFGW